MKVIKISALWCPSCLIMNDVIKKVLSDKSVNLISYDYDIDQDIVNKYNVSNILPVLIKVDDNENEISRLVGEHSEKEIIDFLEG